MADTNGSLTLDGLAQIQRDHMNETAAGFAELRFSIGELRSSVGDLQSSVGELRLSVGDLRGSIADLRGEIGTVAGIVRDLAQVVARHHDDLEEHRRHIAQIFSRLEQHDARFEAITLELREMRTDIRRILDAMERRGDGGRREA